MDGTKRKLDDGYTPRTSQEHPGEASTPTWAPAGGLYHPESALRSTQYAANEQVGPYGTPHHNPPYYHSDLNPALVPRFTPINQFIPGFQPPAWPTPATREPRRQFGRRRSHASGDQFDASSSDIDIDHGKKCAEMSYSADGVYFKNCEEGSWSRTLKGEGDLTDDFSTLDRHAQAAIIKIKKDEHFQDQLRAIGIEKLPTNNGLTPEENFKWCKHLLLQNVIRKVQTKFKNGAMLTIERFERDEDLPPLICSFPCCPDSEHRIHGPSYFMAVGRREMNEEDGMYFCLLCFERLWNGQEAASVPSNTESSDKASTAAGRILSLALDGPCDERHHESGCTTSPTSMRASYEPSSARITRQQLDGPTYSPMTTPIPMGGPYEPASIQAPCQQPLPTSARPPPPWVVDANLNSQRQRNQEVAEAIQRQWRSQEPGYLPANYPQSNYPQSSYAQSSYPQSNFPQSSYVHSIYTPSNYQQFNFQRPSYQPYSYQQPGPYHFYQQNYNYQQMESQQARSYHQQNGSYYGQYPYQPGSFYQPQQGYEPQKGSYSPKEVHKRNENNRQEGPNQYGQDLKPEQSSSQHQMSQPDQQKPTSDQPKAPSNQIPASLMSSRHAPSATELNYTTQRTCSPGVPAPGHLRSSPPAFPSSPNPSPPSPTANLSTPGSTMSDGTWRYPPTRVQHLATQNLIQAGDSLSAREKAAVDLWLSMSREQVKWEQHLVRAEEWRKERREGADGEGGKGEGEGGIGEEGNGNERATQSAKDREDNGRRVRNTEEEVDQEMLEAQTGVAKKECYGLDPSVVLAMVRARGLKAGQGGG